MLSSQVCSEFENSKIIVFIMYKCERIVTNGTAVTVRGRWMHFSKSLNIILTIVHFIEYKLYTKINYKQTLVNNTPTKAFKRKCTDICNLNRWKDTRQSKLYYNVNGSLGGVCRCACYEILCCMFENFHNKTLGKMVLITYYSL